MYYTISMVENSETPPDEVTVGGDTGDLSGKGGIRTEEGDRVTRITHRNPDGSYGGDVVKQGGAQDGARVPDVKINPPPPKSKP